MTGTSHRVSWGFIDRIVFDRAGWNDIHTINVENNINYNDYEIVLPAHAAHIELDDVDNNDSDSDPDSEYSEDFDNIYCD